MYFDDATDAFKVESEDQCYTCAKQLDCPMMQLMSMHVLRFTPDFEDFIMDACIFFTEPESIDQLPGLRRIK